MDACKQLNTNTAKGKTTKGKTTKSKTTKSKTTTERIPTERECQHKRLAFDPVNLDDDY